MSNRGTRMSDSSRRIAKLLLVTVAVAVSFLTSAFLSRSVLAQAHSLSVRNASDYTINELYVSRSGREYWGPNLLRGGPLPPTRTMRLPLAPDRYDMKLVYHEGYVCITQVQVAGDAYIHVTNEWLRECVGRK